MFSLSDGDDCPSVVCCAVGPACPRHKLVLTAVYGSLNPHATYSVQVVFSWSSSAVLLVRTSIHADYECLIDFCVRAEKSLCFVRVRHCIIGYFW